MSTENFFPGLLPARRILILNGPAVPSEEVDFFLIEY
jgi:hypothetical protein